MPKRGDEIVELATPNHCTHITDTTCPEKAPSHDNNLIFHNKNTNHLTPHKTHPIEYLNKLPTST